MAFTVPSYVETVGDRCFEQCFGMAAITFEDASELRKLDHNSGIDPGDR
jgi:hypothetical protein